MLKTKSDKQKTIHITFIFLTFAFLFASCNTTQPPPPPGSKGEIQLTVEDASSTEVWLNVKTQNITLPAELKLYREDSVTQIINLRGTDTLLYDNDLQPNKTYNYKAAYTGGGQTIQSQTVTATTMDTTSHNFTWQTYTFGGVHGSSVLNDVAIINENDIWAVGEIHTAETDQFDSNGVWVQPYNAVHWDGQKWELKRIMFYIDQDQPSAGKTPSPCVASFVFADNKFAITSNVQTAIFDANGDYQILKMGFAWKDRFTINSMWGTSSTDFYVVGNNGNIAHYNGSSWHKIESGTEINLNDIYGYDNAIYFLASELFSGIDSKLYKVENSISVLQADLDLGRESLSLWLFKKKLYIAGGRTFEMTEGKSGLKEITNYVSGAGFYKIRGTNYNDIIIVGSSYEAVHFNGKTWRRNEITVNGSKNGIFTSVSIVSNVICAVGREYGGASAVVSIGIR